MENNQTKSDATDSKSGNPNEVAPHEKDEPSQLSHVLVPEPSEDPSQEKRAGNLADEQPIPCPDEPNINLQTETDIPSVRSSGQTEASLQGLSSGRSTFDLQPTAGSEMLPSEFDMPEIMDENGNPSQRSNYEVVFFVKYKQNPRPDVETMTSYFNQYGTVDHINCPQDKNFAFVFMESLNIDSEHRRTRNTISKIIHEMPAENRFHITVASSNRGKVYRWNDNNNDEDVVVMDEYDAARRRPMFGNRYGPRNNIYQSNTYHETDHNSASSSFGRGNNRYPTSNYEPNNRFHHLNWRPRQRFGGAFASPDGREGPSHNNSNYQSYGYDNNNTTDQRGSYVMQKNNGAYDAVPSQDAEAPNKRRRQYDNNDKLYHNDNRQFNRAPSFLPIDVETRSSPEAPSRPSHDGRGGRSSPEAPSRPSHDGRGGRDQSSLPSQEAERWGPRRGRGTPAHNNNRNYSRDNHDNNQRRTNNPGQKTSPPLRRDGSATLPTFDRRNPHAQQQNPLPHPPGLGRTPAQIRGLPYRANNGPGNGGQSRGKQTTDSQPDTASNNLRVNSYAHDESMSSNQNPAVFLPNSRRNRTSFRSQPQNSPTGGTTRGDAAFSDGGEPTTLHQTN